MAKIKNSELNQGLNFGLDPEALDFSQDMWSWKGDIPSYAIQSDGFSYDIPDENENDKNAISLGLLGMIVIVYNTKSAKIREEDVQPPFREVIAVRNWHTLGEKEANQLGKTVVIKLADAESSGDVFDLASFAPLEIKRVLLKKLFVIARHRLKPEYREEAERRITEDIVPMIFANPELELALLTGLIVKPKAAEPVSAAESVSEPVSHELPAVEETPFISDYDEPISIPDRDAESELKAEMHRLNRAVPKAEVEEVPEEEDDYIPFSDMENELKAQEESRQAPPQVPEKPQPASSGAGERIGAPHFQPSQPWPQPPSQPAKAQVPPPVMPNVMRPPQVGQGVPPAIPYPPTEQPAPYNPQSQYPAPPFPPYPSAPYPQYGNNDPVPPDLEQTQPRKPAA